MHAWDFKIFLNQTGSREKFWRNCWNISGTFLVRCSVDTWLSTRLRRGYSIFRGRVNRCTREILRFFSIKLGLVRNFGEILRIFLEYFWFDVRFERGSRVNRCEILRFFSIKLWWEILDDLLVELFWNVSMFGWTWLELGKGEEGCQGGMADGYICMLAGHGISKPERFYPFLNPGLFIHCWLSWNCQIRGCWTELQGERFLVRWIRDHFLSNFDRQQTYTIVNYC